MAKGDAHRRSVSDETDRINRLARQVRCEEISKLMTPLFSVASSRIQEHPLVLL